MGLLYQINAGKAKAMYACIWPVISETFSRDSTILTLWACSAPDLFECALPSLGNRTRKQTSSSRIVLVANEGFPAEALHFEQQDLFWVVRNDFIALQAFKNLISLVDQLDGGF
jgi:hypothetical protein